MRFPTSLPRFTLATTAMRPPCLNVNALKLVSYFSYPPPPHLQEFVYRYCNPTSVVENEATHICLI